LSPTPNDEIIVEGIFSPEDGEPTMTDRTTGKPLRVWPAEGVGPYISVAVNQLDEVKRLLEGHGLSYWVEENIISINGGPYIATINLRRGTDANTVQAILDSAG
jgi:hypothetical protein